MHVFIAVLCFYMAFHAHNCHFETIPGTDDLRKDIVCDWKWPLNVFKECGITCRSAGMSSKMPLWNFASLCVEEQRFKT